MTLAILSALADEQRGLIEQLHQPHRTLHAGREFWQGQLLGHPVVLALSKIGKVAAATTATALIEKFGATRIVFTGVAGGIGPGVQVGDLVVARQLIQHDLDVSPLFPRFEVPFYGQSCFTADFFLTGQLLRACRCAMRALGASGAVHQGLLASGDQFVSCAQAGHSLRRDLLLAGHDALAVEMEGAAVAQVCHDYNVPFAAVRTISDRADASAHVDFNVFSRDVASRYACAIVQELLKLLSIK
jgi:adenosylhomocysteine nucleosidase